MKHLCTIVAWFTTALSAQEPATTRPQAAFAEWSRSGELWLVTTEDGAALPAGAEVTEFPVLVRLRPGTFAFAEALPHGEDLRVSDAEGRPLAFEIETWDAQAGAADVWVRVPRIVGAARQVLRLHWGNANARPASDAHAVFAADNGFAAALHLGQALEDAVATVHPVDQGTRVVPGVSGLARHFDGRSGVFCGDDIRAFPGGADASTTSAWFRAERANTTVLAWGKEQRPGKVMVNLLAPPHLAIQCYFADVFGTSPVPLGEWVHVVHTYSRGDSRIYVNGALDGTAKPILDIPKPVRFDIGGWRGHGFVGDVDEVRIGTVTRSPEWVRLEHENQKPLQTLVGTLVPPGKEFGLSARELVVSEGGSATVTAQAGGAHKVVWLLDDTVVAVDTFAFTLVAGRVTGDRHRTLRFRASGANGTRHLDVPVTIREAVPEPVLELTGPERWDGRTPLTLTPTVRNREALESAHATDLHWSWRVTGVAAGWHAEPGAVVLERAEASGALLVEVAVDNGGAPTVRTLTLQVVEPAHDAWIPQPVGLDEFPENGAFYARDDQGTGALVCTGGIEGPAEQVFLRVTCDGKPFAETAAPLGESRRYRLEVRLKPGRVHYRAELGTSSAGREQIVRVADDLVCGDAFLIDGQSNAEATDVGPVDPPFRSEWIRSFGCTTRDATSARKRIWGQACCREREEGRLQIGSWAVELGKRLVESQQVPVCFVNGAVGGSRIDQHQRDPVDPESVASIYGRLLWRVRQARLSHGIRAVLWHQGENDQGADGPSGRYGFETWREDFVRMAAGWRRDYPNLQHVYVFQIWPKACAMGSHGSDDRLREVQRTLPRSFARLSVMSTLGIEPPGGCHYPVAGWAEFSRLIAPLIERDLYGKVFTESITAPDLVRASFAGASRDRVVLEFDQPVAWNPAAPPLFTFDGKSSLVKSGSANGKHVTLELTGPTEAQTLTYVQGERWEQKRILRGANGIAALTFCAVPLETGTGR